MDLFRNAATKSYKFLQELDEPTASPGEGTRLEAALEGATAKVLSWNPAGFSGVFGSGETRTASEGALDTEEAQYSGAFLPEHVNETETQDSDAFSPEREKATDAKASSAFISEDSGALLKVRETESHAQNSGTFLAEHETEIDAGAFLQERENETAEQNSGAFLAEHGTETDAQDAGAFFPERENETDGQNSGAFLAEQETETETAAQDSGAFLQERGNETAAQDSGAFLLEYENETNMLDSDAFPQEREKETVASLSEREDVTRRHDNIVNARGLDVFFSEQEDMTEVVTLPGHHIPEHESLIQDFHTLLPEPDAQAFCPIAQDSDAVVAECDVEGKAQDYADTDFVCEGVTSAEDSNSVVLQQVSVRKAQVSDASVADHDIETDAQERARNLDDLAAARAEVLSLQAALERTGLRLGQREQTLVELSQHMAEIERSLQTAEEARLDAENRAKQMGDFVDQADAKLSADGAKFVAMKKRLQQLEAVRDEALSNVETWKERAAAAERRSKQDARDTERELLQAQDTWREKIAAAERRTQEVKQDVEAQVEAAMVERDIAQGEVLRLVEELSGQKALQECAQKEVEAVVERSRAESAHLSERLRSSGETEFQLRREVRDLERSREQAQERCAELTAELERVQSAYSEAAQEIGALSSRLHDLEFGAQAEGSDELVRSLEAAKERIAEVEQRLSECTWMRDYALQQAEDARSQLHALSVEPRVEVSALTDGAQREAEVDKRVTAQVAQLVAEHEEEVQRQSALFKEEIGYLKKKGDEKDRRLEALICERNSLRFETEQKPKPHPPSRRSVTDDLEEGPPTPGNHRCARVAEGEVLLRRFSRLLVLSPCLRRLFYLYLFFLHVWAWFLLHRVHHGP